MNQVTINLKNIVKNRFQQEGVKNDAKVLEIASSLQQNKDNGTKGLLQVPTARAIEGGKYELAFGHHRYHAFDHLANVTGDSFFAEMPLIVRELSDIEMFELMGIENFHRRDISPVEEANIFHVYMSTFNKTSVETAAKFEKTEEYVRASIRLLNLPEEAKKLIEAGTINKSAARDLLVLGTVGGAGLVKDAIELIGARPDENPRELIEDVIRDSDDTKWLDTNEGWFSANKNFPHKHLPALKKAELEELVHYKIDYSSGIPIKLIDEILTYISSGMEVTDEAFEAINPDDLVKVRVLANPTPCEKCPLHAVFNGDHFCGLPLCRDRKVKAWEIKQQEDKVKKVGVPLYQKSDGEYIKLNQYNDADKKLWSEKGADLRLMPSRNQYNNFDGLDQDLIVVVIGPTAAKRLKKEAQSKSKEVEEREDRAVEVETHNLKVEFVRRFSWEIASREFESLLGGINSPEFLSFLVGNYCGGADLPEGLDNDELIEAANKIKKASDKSKELRRLAIHGFLDAHIYSSDMELSHEDKKPIKKHAQNFQTIADLWGVKLSKDFQKQAEKYQTELDAAIKEVGKKAE